MKATTYRLYDSSLIVHKEIPRTDDFLAFDEELVNSLKRTMKKAGYTFRQDTTVHKLIRRCHFAGSKDDVFFVCEAGVTGLKIEFYENVIRDNKCGGRYHFDKMAKMPYLRRLKVQLIHQKLAARLEILGFTDSTPVTSKSAEAFVLQERADLMAFQGDHFYEDPRYWDNRNSEDADDKKIVEGQVKYFYHWSGTLMRGVAWHHINNMWWVIVSKDEVHNIASFELFDYDPSKHARRGCRDAKGRMERELAKLVKAQKFEKAIGLRDALRKLEPTPAGA